MNSGFWVWPSDARSQRLMLAKVSGSQHIMAALAALAKTKDGLSNAELDYLMSDNSNWMTLWVIKQLTALGFINLKVDFFGGPCRYELTELGRMIIPILMGQPIPPKQVSPPPSPPVQVAHPVQAGNQGTKQST